MFGKLGLNMQQDTNEKLRHVTSISKNLHNNLPQYTEFVINDQIRFCTGQPLLPDTARGGLGYLFPSLAIPNSQPSRFMPGPLYAELCRPALQTLP